MIKVKLHKEKSVSLLIIPNCIIESIGWTDEQQLFITNNDNALNITLRGNDSVLNGHENIGPSSNHNSYSGKNVLYNKKLYEILNRLPLSVRRSLLLSLLSVDVNIPESLRLVQIRAADYTLSSGASSSLSYMQLKETDDYFKANDFEFIESTEYISGEGLLKITFSPEILNYVYDVKASEQDIISVNPKHAIKLVGKYSWSLYHLIQSRRVFCNGIFSIGVDELKCELNCYTDARFPIFKRDVINFAIKEITNKTEIKHLTCINERKEGRKVSTVRFEFNCES
ncbi:TPA: RepB family plasmid replication initiator protein [Yersinia enterocolitica]